MDINIENLEGRQFTKLLVIKYIGLTGGGQKKKDGGIHKGYHTWLCRCDCGKEVNVREVKLKAGHSRSCGCSRKYNKPIWTLPKGEAAKNLLFFHYKDSAKKRGLEFSLERDSFIELTSSDCKYCGEPPTKSMALRQKGKSRHRSLNGDYLYNGIDRVDNNVGYIEGNCVPCCWLCNELKKARTQDEFISHILKIADNWSRTQTSAKSNLLRSL